MVTDQTRKFCLGPKTVTDRRPTLFESTLAQGCDLSESTVPLVMSAADSRVRSIAGESPGSPRSGDMAGLCHGCAGRKHRFKSEDKEVQT